MNRADIYLAGWRTVPRLPRTLVTGASDAAADAVALANGKAVRTLAANHERILGRPVSRPHIRQAVRSHFRTYAEQFSLTGMDQGDIDAAVRFPRFDDLVDLATGGPVIMALTHSGNWDLAGAWVASHGLPILTVAEKLDPPELFEAFVDFRQGLGMEIIGAGKGESVFGRLVEGARGREIAVPLLADRDISGSGIEVNLGEHRALVAAGPAALAQRLGRPLVGIVIHYERRDRGQWGVVLEMTDPIEPPGPRDGLNAVEAHTHAWVAAVAPLLRRYVRDWHMMQPVFVEDLDPQRLARARERHRRFVQEEEAS